MIPAPATRHDKAKELRRLQRLVQQDHRRRHRKQRREVAERRRDHRSERPVRGKSQKRQRGREEQADGDENRQAAPDDRLVVEDQRRQQQEQQRERGDADCGPRERIDGPQAQLRQNDPGPKEAGRSKGVDNGCCHEVRLDAFLRGRRVALSPPFWLRFLRLANPLLAL
jgi:hypothetical protein